MSLLLRHIETLGGLCDTTRSEMNVPNIEFGWVPGDKAAVDVANLKVVALFGHVKIKGRCTTRPNKPLSRR